MAALDDVQFLRHIGIGAVVGGNHFFRIVPAEAKGIAHAAGENLRRFALVRVHAPDGRGQIHFAAIVIARVFARLIAICAGTARNVKKTIGALRDVIHAVIERADTPWVGLAQKRLGYERLRVLAAINRHLIGDKRRGFQLAIARDEQPAGLVEGKAPRGRITAFRLQVLFTAQHLLHTAARIDFPNVPIPAENIDVTAAGLERESNGVFGEPGHFANRETIRRFW